MHEDGAGGEPPDPVAPEEIQAVEAPPPDDEAPGVEIPPGYELCHGRLVRKRQGSGRPPDIDPDLWRQLSHTKRTKLTKEWLAKKSQAAQQVAAACVTCDSVPAMPVFPHEQHEHREQERKFLPLFQACVARPVSRKESRTNPAARAALDKEWDRLRAAGCWDEKSVCEWSEVAGLARKSQTKAHLGRIFDICVEKGSELPEGHPGRKFKGRVVFQGNNVKDENWNVAMFQDLSSSPATMSAAKFADAIGLLAGNAVEIADAEQAYIQAELATEVPTWVELPPERWPASWSKYQRPVCKLRLALYGHPDSGGFWERHCEKHLKSVGFVPVRDWRSVFIHPALGALLVVYVDDFKMAGPAGKLPEAWRLIRSGIKTEDPSALTKYLGCEHTFGEIRVKPGQSPAEVLGGRPSPGGGPLRSAEPGGEPLQKRR